MPHCTTESRSNYLIYDGTKQNDHDAAIVSTSHASSVIIVFEWNGTTRARARWPIKIALAIFARRAHCPLFFSCFRHHFYFRVTSHRSLNRNGGCNLDDEEIEPTNALVTSNETPGHLCYALSPEKMGKCNAEAENSTGEQMQKLIRIACTTIYTDVGCIIALLFGHSLQCAGCSVAVNYLPEPPLRRKYKFTLNPHIYSVVPVACHIQMA